MTDEGEGKILSFGRPRIGPLMRDILPRIILSGAVLPMILFGDTLWVGIGTAGGALGLFYRTKKDGELKAKNDN